jgi:trigger factor
VQVEFNAINAVSKEINITVPAEEATKAWEKYLRKAAKQVDVPGFRKGKAPLSLIERSHGALLTEHFLKDSVSDFFEAAAKEHDINYLLFPDVKDVQWENGTDLLIKIEIEHEPTLEFTQLDHLDVPYNPITLDSEVDKYLEELKQNSGTIIDADEALENDHVSVELTIMTRDNDIVQNASFFAGSYPERRALPELIGKKVGETLEKEISGTDIKLVSRDASLNLANDNTYPVKIMVNSIERMQYPELNDDFAKDMEFDDMAAMRAKIAEDMRLANEHKNLDVMNYALVGKLFVDNNFDLPMKTISYLAEQEAQKHPNREYHKYLEYQYRMQISQEMVTMYILKQLRNQVEIEITEEMFEEYIKHEAILADHTVEAYKEAHKEEIASAEYQDGVRNFYTLRKLAETANYFIPEPEQQEEITEAETVSIEESDQES